MDQETTAKILSGAAGLFSVVAILLLLYIVVCEVFFNHGGHTEKVFGKKESSKAGKHTPVIMPIVTGGVALIVNLIVANTMYTGTYITAKSGAMSLIAVEGTLTSVKSIILCIVSILLLTLGSVIFDKIGGPKYSTLYCLNIALSLMVLPYTYSLIALIFAVGFWAFKKKEYLSLAIAVVAGIAVHFPVDGFHLGEAFMLIYLLLIPLMAKLDNTKFRWLTTTLAIACGFFTIFSQLIYRFI